jgi:hypothetical protein
MVLTAIAVLMGMPQRGQPDLRIGGQAPEISVESIEDAGRFVLSENRGKRNTVLIFGSCT